MAKTILIEPQGKLKYNEAETDNRERCIGRENPD